LYFIIFVPSLYIKRDDKGEEETHLVESPNRNVEINNHHVPRLVSISLLRLLLTKSFYEKRNQRIFEKRREQRRKQPQKEIKKKLLSDGGTWLN
jgi:hypothetical protein